MKTVILSSWTTKALCVVIGIGFVLRVVDACSGRTVFTELQGTIQDGPANYPENTQCEWLINAPQSNMSITLTFLEYDTECTYDYLYILDGPSYTSPLLASFSGNHLPDKVVAHSGKMLIHLYSDANYARSGFVANYTIDNCTSGCSGHGECVGSACVCNSSWHGKACDLRSCPNDCNQTYGHGFCDQNAKHCACSNGYGGESCALAFLDNTGSNAWYKMVTQSPVFTPRMSHDGVYYNDRDSVYVFGGFDLNSAADDLLEYNITSGLWNKIVTSNTKPTGRYSHTVSLYKDSLLVFGGHLSGGLLTNELWMFNISSQQWTQLAVGDQNAPPPLAGHTANSVDTKLYVYGGRTDNTSLSSAMYVYTLGPGGGWQKVKYTSGKETEFRVVGHTSVYHPDTNSLVVFGGYTSKSARMSERMNRIHAFHLDELVWTEWQTPGDNNVPIARAFHSATLVRDYIVVFGGTRHTHSLDETCYDKGLHFYHLPCRKWVPRSVFNQQTPSITPPEDSPRGRLSHVAVLRDSTLMIIGGYAGVPLGDTYAYKLPTGAAAVNQSGTAITGAHCTSVTVEATCKSDHACGWCNGNPAQKCFPTEESSKCLSGWSTGSCPGPCAVHAQCTSCLAWGTRHTPRCGWCVQDSQCYPTSAPSGACQAPTSSNQNSIRGWWGTSGQFLTSSISDCRYQDYPPGLLEVSYFYPKNQHFPDYVAVSSDSKFEIVAPSHLNRYWLLSAVEQKEIRGFIYPHKYRTMLRYYHMWLKVEPSKYSSGTVYLSTDSASSNEENVGECKKDGRGTSCQANLLRSPTNRHLFENPREDKKYYIKLEAVRQRVPDTLSLKSTYELTWEGYESQIFEQLPIKGSNLQPYTGDGTSCSTHKTCMACMTDMACGWCDVLNTCMKRNVGNACMYNGHQRHLSLNATQCTRCDDHKDCNSCNKNPWCEWFIGQFCVRKDVILDAYVVTSCGNPCLSRKTCGECVSDKTGCAWCDSLSQCFVFGSYITRYPHGECSHWIDSLASTQCRNCNAHTTCKACLADYKCGWCGNTNNPLLGRCFSGDFQGPHQGACSSNAINVTGSAAWTYEKCPDVDECRLGLDTCHHNATCMNTYESYYCVCNPGYTGDGVTACNKTCYPACVHGTCGPDYLCDCNLGWLGTNCTIDCGCHGHSSCNQGIGICDQCQDNTHGNYCELCVTGSYGNATTAHGCRACECNGHGDVTLGVCDGVNGTCFCKDNTEGDHCERCMPGLKGDPRNGGRCYYECKGRSILTNVTQGDISTAGGDGVTSPSRAGCIWVISASLNTSHEVIYRPPELPSRSSITLTFTNMSVDCMTDHVVVYDGLPPFILGSPPPVPPTFYKLGSFCGPLQNQRSIAATLGNMVVVFKADISGALSAGFSAVFSVRRCSDNCHGNRRCAMTSQGEACVCQTEWTGPECNIPVCPNNCSNHGTCDAATGRCKCNVGKAGIDCKTTIPAGRGSWELLSDITYQNRSSSTLARMAHSLVTSGQSLWMFGGYSMAYGPLDDVMTYDVSALSWSRVVTNQIAAVMPTARYLHCAVLHQGNMVVFGGIAAQGVSNEVWHLNLSPPSWTRKTPSSPGPLLAGHTCTLAGDVITVIGGYNPISGFNGRVYQYHVTNMAWSTMEPLGTQPAGLYGHTAVYHARTQSILVFGGYGFKWQSVQASAELYSLHLPSRRWSLLQALPGNQPSPKYFHTSDIIGDNMVVYGGRTNTGGQSLSDELLIYKVSCNYWHDMREQASAIVGVNPDRVLAAASSVLQDKVYLFGGSDGEARSSLHRLTLPTEPCHGLPGRTECTAALGCSWCELHNVTLSLNASNIVNKSACYSITSAVPAVCHATPNVTHVVFYNGTQCDVTAAKQRACSTYPTCAACLGRYTDSSGVASPCAWCLNCPSGGKCVPQPGTDCATANPCGSTTQTTVTTAASCRESTTQCEAATCSSCTGGSCLWTPQLRWMTESNQGFSSNGAPYPWSCFRDTLLSSYPAMSVKVTQASSCPSSCTVHTDCQSCLSSTGGDGGWNECVWSESLGKCYSPSYLPLLGVPGGSGRVVRGSPQSCMPACTLSNHCALCLGRYNCVWCGKQGSNGLGVCMEGGLKGPLYGTCKGNVIDSGRSAYSNITTHISTIMSPVWAPLLCPLENECLNGRHNCTSLQDCVDTPESYTCVCKTGYEQKGRDLCIPICNQGCEHGKCIAPDKCQCNFGWTSSNCTVECLCNGHGHCANETSLDICTDCRNQTTGIRCQHCKPLYVGDARENGTCISCYNMCNHSAQVCMNKTDLLRAKHMNLSLDPQQVVLWLNHGPLEILEDGECLCGNLSRGKKCKNCETGNFFFKGYCSTCRCNGHGTKCNENTGACQCYNQTAENCRTSREPCYDQQCSKCIDGYLGVPANSRQCYSKISHMQEFVISKKPKAEINKNAPPLAKGLTVPYVIFPKYTNVDIRTTIDVFHGSIDVFITTDNQALSVLQNKSTYEHHVIVNQRTRKRRSTADQHPDGVTEVFAGPKKLNTFVTYKVSDYVIKVRSVQRRLIITFPYTEHKLRSRRFYLLFYGVGSPVSSDTTGIVYFRQDLTNIDLFVFFSVFFSVFFLVLSICVVAWKMKQLHDRRRIAQVQERELETMASRPFSVYSFLVDTHSPPHKSCWKVKRESSRLHMRGENAQNARKAQIYMRDAGERPVIGQAAIEATADTKAAVVTVMFQLPGNENSQFQLSFGSAITMTSPQHSLGTLFGHQLLNGQRINTRHTVTVTS